MRARVRVVWVSVAVTLLIVAFAQVASAQTRRPLRGPPAAAAPAGASLLVGEVRVDGVQRIDPDTVRAYANVRPGDRVDAERLDQALRALFATGLFQDVNVGLEGTTVVLQVRENPIINRVQFEGNRRVSDESLTGEVQSRARTVYTRTRVQNDVRRILEIYRRTGRFAATVEPKIIELPQNRVDLVFEITEGGITGVNRINFVANQAFSSGRLRETIRTRETRWYRILSTDDNYDPDRVAFDRELLRRYYLSQGYADFRVVSSVAELSPDREGFFVTFTLDEGERYRFGRIDVASSVRNLNLDDVRNRVQAREGDWYNANRVEASINALTEALGDLGYAFVDVRPRVERDRDNKSIAITFEIQEGPRVFVDRINVIGNVRTLDRVIRREMRLAEGDAFNSTRLRRSRDRIRALGFFERVEVTNTPSDAPDRTNINVEVAERSTGELSFGVGFSTAEGPLGDVSIRERNLLGRGQDIRLGFSLSQRRQQADFSFTEPYFLDRNIAAGLDLFRIERDFTRESDYRLRRTGGGIRFGYRLTEQLTQIWRYGLRQDEIFDVGGLASLLIREQQGRFITSSVGTTLLYDRRDDPNDPTDGWFVSGDVDVAGLGGDTRYVRGRLRGGVYYPVVEDWILSLTAEAGVIHGFGGRTVRLFDRWFVGGDNLRGFRQSGIGPRALTGEALGGNRYAVASVELSFPTPTPPEFGLRGFVFADSGILWQVDRSSTNLPFQDTRSVRLSAGVGVNWRSPFGPIRVSVGRAILKEDFDRTETVRFGFGTRF